MVRIAPKFVLVLVSVFMLGCAAAFILVGAFNKIYYLDIGKHSVSNFCIAVGVIAGVIALVGGYEAFNDSRAIVIIFAVLLIILGALATALGIWVMMILSDSDGSYSITVEDYLFDLYQHFHTKPTHTTAVNVIQRRLECCGIRSNAEQDVRYGVNKGDSLIATCCDLSVTTCTRGVSFEKGCLQASLDYLKVCFCIVAFFAIGLATLSFVLAGLSICVLRGVCTCIPQGSSSSF